MGAAAHEPHATVEATDHRSGATRWIDGREPVVAGLGTGWVRWLYEAAMVLMALVVVWLLTLPDEGWARATNIAIWAVFVIDYAARLALSSDRRAFVRRNLPDLVAILPLDLFRVARLARLARLLRLLRAGAILWRTTRHLRGVLSTNGLGWLLVVTTLIVVAGAFAGWVVEPELTSFGDALWWSIVTATTVGYGDISPSSPLGRLVAVLLMLVGIGSLGMITGSIATYFMADRSPAPSDEHVAALVATLQRWDDLEPGARRQVLAMLQAACDPR